MCITKVTRCYYINIKLLLDSFQLHSPSQGGYDYAGSVCFVCLKEELHKNHNDNFHRSCRWSVTRPRNKPLHLRADRQIHSLDIGGGLQQLQQSRDRSSLLLLHYMFTGQGSSESTKNNTDTEDNKHSYEDRKQQRQRVFN